MASEDKKKKKIKGFKEFDSSKYINTEPRIDEAVKGTVVVAWGRMNPMTAGHEKLVKKVISVAKAEKGTPEIYLTHSFDKKKNPISYDDKIRLAQKAFGPVVKKSNAKTIFQLMAQLNTRYNRVVLIAGSDRVEEFTNTLKKYNGKEYNFDDIKVVSAGQRDEEAEDVSGISGTKMRNYAATDMKKFTSNLPKNLKGDAVSIAALVRKGMGMNEEVETDLDEALTRAQRIKRSRAMKRARFKIRRGKERSERKTASMAVLRRRARKEALKMLKKKFTKSRDYGDLSAGEKEVIDRRVEKIPKKRIDQIARKLIPSVRKRDRERLSSKNEDLNTRFEAFLNEASCADTQIRKRPHQLFDSNNRVKIDRRFRMYKNKVNEGYEDLAEELATFTLDMDSYIESLDEVAVSATKKAVNVVGPDGRTRTVWKRTKSVAKDEHGQDKLSTNEDYYKGVPKDKRDDRKRHFERNAKKADDDPSAYRPAPGDKDVETKLSKHTKKYRQMYGEMTEISEDATASLKKKSEKTGMPLSVLRKVYNRGVAAWKTGHRPGTTPEQWGHARVNSFVTKSSGTWGKADKDLASQVRKEETELDEAGGAGEWGTSKLTNKFKKDTPAEK